MIDRFEGKYAFLSNFYRHKFRYRNQTYRTAEHAFQAQKCVRREDMLRIKQAATPGEAKRLGRQVEIRLDWDLVKVNIMAAILREKFKHPGLRELLLATGDELLIEGNNWSDVFWGQHNGRGKNHLGIILMELRKSVRDE